MSQDPDPNDLDGLIRRVDPDRWMSSRFIADEAARADVITLYAFDHELARAPKVASNPLIGEIRLTWWREVLDEVETGKPVRQHPTALALAELMTRKALGRAGLEALIDARYRELDSEPMTLDEALTWARETGGAVAVLAAGLLDPGASADAARAGGMAWAIGRLMRTAGLTGPEAVAALKRERHAARGLSAAAFPAIAHAALAPEGGSDLSRQGRLIWAVLKGRL
jgi:phytoene synthase